MSGYGTMEHYRTINDGSMYRVVCNIYTRLLLHGILICFHVDGAESYHFRHFHIRKASCNWITPHTCSCVGETRGLSSL